MNNLSKESIESLRRFLESIESIENNWRKVYEQIGLYDHEISDLLHEIELTEFNSEEGIWLSEEIKRIRTERRELKNYQEIVRHMKEYLDRNKNFKIQLYRVLNSMERTISYQGSRTYTPRVRKDLKLCSSEYQKELHSDVIEIDDTTEYYNDHDLSLTGEFDVPIDTAEGSV